MKGLRALVAPILVCGLIGTATLQPVSAAAQTSRQIHHRQQTKNSWRNLGIGSAALGALGLLSHDSTLVFVGAAGALYSASRYEHDRRSESRMQRARAAYFARRSFRRNGHLYVRHTVWKHGVKYYYFKRSG